MVCGLMIVFQSKVRPNFINCRVQMQYACTFMSVDLVAEQYGVIIQVGGRGGGIVEDIINVATQEGSYTD